jgi:hypothetical protein
MLTAMLGDAQNVVLLIILVEPLVREGNVGIKEKKRVRISNI